MLRQLAWAAASGSARGRGPRNGPSRDDEVRRSARWSGQAGLTLPGAQEGFGACDLHRSWAGVGSYFAPPVDTGELQDVVASRVRAEAAHTGAAAAVPQHSVHPACWGTAWLRSCRRFVHCKRPAQFDVVHPASVCSAGLAGPVPDRSGACMPWETHALVSGHHWRTQVPEALQGVEDEERLLFTLLQAVRRRSQQLAKPLLGASRGPVPLRLGCVPSHLPACLPAHPERASTEARLEPLQRQLGADLASLSSRATAALAAVRGGASVGEQAALTPCAAGTGHAAVVHPGGSKSAVHVVHRANGAIKVRADAATRYHSSLTRSPLRAPSASRCTTRTETARGCSAPAIGWKPRPQLRHAAHSLLRLSRPCRAGLPSVGPAPHHPNHAAHVRSPQHHLRRRGAQRCLLSAQRGRWTTSCASFPSTPPCKMHAAAR